nr:tyrosine-type recombinase/integrase [Janthinobacterium sp. LM6]
MKRGNDCLLLMTNSLRAVMKRRFKTRIDKRVFPMKREKLHADTVWVQNVVKRSGVSLEGGKINSHTFRHSCATRLLRAGMDITMVQKFLGHKNIASTMVYLHTLPSEVASKAVAVFNSG